MNNKTVPAFILLSVVAGCQHVGAGKDSATEQLRGLVGQYRNDVPMSGLKSILVVTEEGCPGCNKSLARLVEDYLADTSTLVWVSAVGGMVDISPFKAEPERVVWDYGDSLRSLGIIKGSGAIFLDSGKIDTVIQLDARNLGTALALVSDRLSTPANAPADNPSR